VALNVAHWEVSALATGIAVADDPLDSRDPSRQGRWRRVKHDNIHLVGAQVVGCRSEGLKSPFDEIDCVLK
jgi:hypothetical protein